MKYIQKGVAPEPFVTWMNLVNDDWLPTYEGLQNPEKRSVHEALLQEQCFVCCYCGRGVELESSHIEHFQPQEKREDLALDFQNLHASCIRETKPGAPLHCGHLKGEWYEDVHAISPLDADCEERFTYTLDGHIKSANLTDVNAHTMCEKLGLDVEFLCNRREEVLKGVFDNDFLSSASRLELEKIRDAFRQSNNGRLPSFGHVVSRYAEQYLWSVA